MSNKGQSLVTGEELEIQWESLEDIERELNSAGFVTEWNSGIMLVEFPAEVADAR